MKLYISPKPNNLYEKIEVEEMTIHVSSFSELRFWWEIWKWLRKPYQYLEVEVHTRPFVRRLTEIEAQYVYVKYIQSKSYIDALSRVRIFTNTLERISGEAHTIFDLTNR